MITRAFHRVILLSAVLLDSVVQGARAQEKDGVSFRPPEEVVGFRLANQQSEPGAGAQLRYQQPGRPEWIDVYVYRPGGERGCQQTCDSIAANNEADDFSALIPELLARRYYDSLRVAHDERLELPGGGPARFGRHLTLRGAREGHVIASQYYLVPLGPMMLKVRATYPPDAAMDSMVDAFTRGIVRGVSSTACAGGRPRSDGVEMSVELAQPIDGLRPRIAAVFKKLGYEMAPADGNATTWRALPLQAWPDRELWSEMRPKPNAALVAWARAEPKGGKTQLHFGAQATCGIPQDRQAETSAALMAALELMTEFEKP